MSRSSAIPLAPSSTLPRTRWLICLLLFLATEINYIDRQVIGLLKSTLSHQYAWTETNYANIIFAFQAAYALGLILAGRFIDHVGVKIGLALAVLAWSLAAAAHGLVALPLFAACTVPAFAAARAALGLAEAANFPAAIKATALWFPQQERALATGLFNAGSNIGALTAPYLVPLLTIHLGWPAAFYITGALGLLWLIFWLLLYRTPDSRIPSLTPEPRTLNPSTAPASAGSLLATRQTWAFALAKFLTDPFWWFYLFWVPGFLYDKFHVQITELFPPLVTIYGFSSFGSVAGGYLSSTLIKHRHSANFARKIALLACALAVIPIVLAPHVALWPAVLLIALAAAAHQGFSANLFTLASDTIPPSSLSSVVGIGGTAGAIGGMLVAKFTGYILDLTHGNYSISFLLPSIAYLLALLLIHLLLPKLQPLALSPRNHLELLN